MAHGRMLNRSISDDMAIDALPDDTCRLLFSWLIPWLCPEGRFWGEPKMILAKILPWRRDLTEERVDNYLDAMAAQNLIVRYTVKRVRYLYFPGFDKNQPGLRKDREAPSPFPSPCTDDCISTPELLQSDDGVTPELLQSDDGVYPAQVKGEVKGEVKVKGGGEGEEPDSATSATYDAFLQARGGAVNAMDSEQLFDLESLYGPDTTVQAIRWCNEHRDRPFLSIGYIGKTLAGWQKDGKLCGARASPGNGTDNGKVIHVDIDLPTSPFED